MNLGRLEQALLRCTLTVSKETLSARVPAMIFRQFVSAEGDSSYLLADPVTRYAALVDPHVQTRRGYGEVIGRLDLRLVYLIETHAHESHLSAAPVLREETGARLIAHSSADLACVDLHVDDGDSNAELQPGTSRRRFIERKRSQATPAESWPQDTLAANRRCQPFN